ncbi:MAG: hypothetical protein QOG04_1092 [Actinomycetota bacterium]|jgi:predicted amidophosphoribosyltransferase|nr:hypothetical protein [Actinomycetota bacterium]
MLLDRTVSLAARPRCFGCRAPGDWLCSSCDAGLGPPLRTDLVPRVDRLWTPWAYEGAARDLVLALKLRARRPAAIPLADTLARAIQATGSAATVITWVPGRRPDSRARGFDHAELIARSLGECLGLPVHSLLARTGDRPDQTTLSGSDRRSNLKSAFVALQTPQKVLLVDDLVTTGATAGACAGSLRDRGATYVEVAAPCRA